MFYIQIINWILNRLKTHKIKKYLLNWKYKYNNLLLLNDTLSNALTFNFILVIIFGVFSVFALSEAAFQESGALIFSIIFSFMIAQT